MEHRYCEGCSLRTRRLQGRRLCVQLGSPCVPFYRLLPHACRHSFFAGLMDLFTAFAEYGVYTEIPTGMRKLESNEGISWPAWTGVLGMPGQTAYMGWKEYGKPKKVRSKTRYFSLSLQDLYRILFRRGVSFDRETRCSLLLPLDVRLCQGRSLPFLT